MKGFYLFILLLIVFHCNLNIPIKVTPDPIPTLSLNKNTATVSYSEGSLSINIFTTSAWEASSNTSWCTLDATSGNSYSLLKISYTTNTKDVKRNCTITIHSITTPPLTATFILTQQVLVSEIILNTSTVTLLNSQVSTNISLTSTIDWRATSSDSWCTLSSNIGQASSTNTTITIQVGTNTTTIQRKCTVTFSPISGTTTTFDKTVVITQLGSSPALVINTPNFTVNKNAGYHSISVTSNVAWVASSLDTSTNSTNSWCMAPNFSSVGTVSLSVAVNTNSSASSRTCAISFRSAKGNFFNVSMSIQQLGVFSLSSHSTDGGFTPGGIIPNEFKNRVYNSVSIQNQCNGGNNFPKLSWRNIPLGTLSFALIIEDTTDPFVHLYLHSIAGDIINIPKIISFKPVAPLPQTVTFPSGVSGKNSWATSSFLGRRIANSDVNSNGWAGFCPLPSTGSHMYAFKLYALNVATLPTSGNSVISSDIFEQLNSSNIIDSSVITAIATDFVEATPPFISIVNSNPANVSGNETILPITVTSNVRWMATFRGDDNTPATYCTGSNSIQSAGTREYSVTIAASSVMSGRSCTIVFQGVDDGSITATFLINQGSGTQSPRIEIDTPTPMTVTASENTLSISVSSNIPWVASSSQSYCSVPIYNANSSMYSITVSTNLSNNRSCSLTFRGTNANAGVSANFLIFQSSAPSISVGINTPITSIYTNNTVTIPVSSNIAWTATSNQSYCTAPSGNYGFGTTMYMVTVAENTGLARNCTITFTGIAPNTTVTTNIEIRQNRIPFISVATSIGGRARENTVTIEIGSNISWRATSNQTYCSAPSGINLATITEYRVSLTTNTGSSRNCTITFTGESPHNTVTDSIIINQDGVFTLSSSLADGGFNSQQDANGVGGAIPIEFSDSIGRCGGSNNFPKLSWSNIPIGTQSLVLIVEDDLDFVHLNLYNIASTQTSILKLVSTGSNPKQVSFTGIGTTGDNTYSREANSVANTSGWAGPCPLPTRSATIYFTLYALNTTLPSLNNLNTDSFVTDHRSKILDAVEINGTVATISSTLALTSSQSDSGFNPDGVIPAEFKENLNLQCLGKNNFPKLSWSNVPVGTQSFILIVEDNIADIPNFVHLNLYNIASSRTFIPKIDSTGVVPKQVDFTGIGSVGQNNWYDEGVIINTSGWSGPCPPIDSGEHSYLFSLYALNTTLTSLDQITITEFNRLHRSKILDQSTISAKSSYTDGRFTLSSSATDSGFNPGGVIPAEFSDDNNGQCSGNNNFPKLSWSNIPSNTQSFVLIVEDSTADFVHLNLYNITSSLTSISKLTSTGTAPRLVDFTGIGSVGTNSWVGQGVSSVSSSGWAGPCPPASTHTYNFKLYALNTTIASLDNTRRSTFETANASKIIVSSEISGTVSP